MSELNKEVREWLLDHERNCHLRDMRHMAGWQLFSDIALSMLKHMEQDFWRAEELPADAVAQKRAGVKEAMLLWNRLSEIVENAVYFCDPAEVEVQLYSLSQKYNVE